VTTATTPLPPWLLEAVVGLVAVAYEAGRGDATPPAAPVDTLTLNEAAASLRVGMTTLNRLVTTGVLPSFRVGARRFVRVADLDEYRARAAR